MLLFYNILSDCHYSDVINILLNAFRLLKKNSQNSNFVIVMNKSLLTDENVWFFCDLSLKFIPPINIWKICIDLRLFSKWVEPFLRPLRSKDVRGWILRLRPQNFLESSLSLAANLEKVRQTSVWQMIPKFWSICLFYCFSKTYSCKYCKKKGIKVK